MATTLNIIDAAGANTGKSVDIQDAWLERTKGEQAVKDSVVAFMAGLRAGSANTKTRGNVAGGGAKPWRQKGNGRARSGSSRSPVWRGGGIAFGPQSKNYDKKVNRKIETLALRRAFTDRLDESAVILVDQLPEMTESVKVGNTENSELVPKTKKMVAFLKAINAGEHVLVLDDEIAGDVELAARNLPAVLVARAFSVNPYLMMRFDKIVITKAGLEALGERLA